MNPFMLKTTLLLLFFHSLSFVHVKTQNPSENEDDQITSQDNNSMTNFQPSLAVVIAMLAVMFSLTFILVLYAKFCHRPSSFQHRPPSVVPHAPPGIDKTDIESLPFFRFSMLKGSREGLECAVCLSRFVDIDILRLLPKCKHAFHLDCVDQWLEKHSSCPLCRQKVGKDDLSQMTYSNSLRFLQEELFVEREESTHYGSSRFSSFRKIDEENNEELLPICDMDSDENYEKALHRFNHKIVVSDVVLKNRWSDVSKSDIMFLNSEMINDASSKRFSCLDSRNEMKSIEIVRGVDGNDHLMNIKEEIERKRVIESKINRSDCSSVFSDGSEKSFRKLDSVKQDRSMLESKVLNSNGTRSMSEIIIHPRFRDLSLLHDGDGVNEERNARVWLPIARKTVEWFANREITRPTTQSHRRISQAILDV